MKRFASICVAMVPAIALFAATPAEQAAEAAAKKYVAAMEKGSLVEVFSMLPKSYQKDMKEVVQAFGGTMDADVWKEVQGLVGALAEIGIVKSALVAEMMADGEVPDTDAAETVKKTAQALKGLSGKLTLDVLKQGNLADILSMSEFTDVGGAARVMDDSISGMTVSNAKAGEDGVVSLTFADKEGETEEAEFVEVEGAWVPREMADGWKEGIAEAKSGIQGLKLDAGKKQQILGMLPMIKMGLQNAKNAATKDQLSQSMMMAFMPVMMMGAGNDMGGGMNIESMDDDE